MSKIKDGYSAELAASNNVTEDTVLDLYLDGHASVPIPEDVDVEDYKYNVIEFIKGVWGEPEVNFDYGDVEFDTEVDGSTLYIKVI